MKKSILSAALLLLAFTLPAQQSHKHQGKKKHPEITELVSDLSAAQKRKLETISSDSKQRVEGLRKQQRAVHDSIGAYMEREGDQSKVLYPLFDRESKLHAQISREMYATRVRIDEVLTPAQRQELKQSMKPRGNKRKR